MMHSKTMLSAAAAGAIIALSACATQPSGEPPMTRPAPIAALTGTEWAVTSIAGKPVLPGSKVTMQFADGRVFGAASCNRFMGGYTAGDGFGIELSQMASTMMACPDALMAQEQLFLDTLGAVTSYAVDGRTATLKTKDGRTIVASRP